MKTYTIKELRLIPSSDQVKSFLDWLEAQEEEPECEGKINNEESQSFSIPAGGSNWK